MTVATGTFMAPLDSSIVNIALPTIAGYFNASIVMIQWVVLSYLLTIGTLLLTFGRLGDLYGHKRIYVIGIAVFTVGSALCSLSWSIWALIGFRVAQALGAGMMMAIGAAIVTDVFPPQNRGKALGFVASSVSAGLLLGPALGGIITGFLKWQWIFYINIPIGILVFVVAFSVLKESRPDSRSRFDGVGAFLAFVALMSILAALNRGTDWGWLSPLTLTAIISGLTAAVVFIFVESRVSHPMMDLDLFKNRIFLTGNFSSMVSYVAINTMVFIMPFYLIQGMGMGPAKAGLIMAALPALNVIIGPLSGSISDKIGTRLPAVVGMILMSVGLFGLRTLSLSDSALTIMARLMLIGIGSGIFQTPNNSAVMGSVPKRQLGIAAGTISTMRNVGMMLGVAMSGTVLAVMKPKYLERLLGLGQSGSAAEKAAMTSAFHDAFTIAAAICILGAITSVLQESKRRPTTERITS